MRCCDSRRSRERKLETSRMLILKASCQIQTFPVSLIFIILSTAILWSNNAMLRRKEKRRKEIGVIAEVNSWVSTQIQTFFVLFILMLFCVLKRQRDVLMRRQKEENWRHWHQCLSIRTCLVSFRLYHREQSCNNEGKTRQPRRRKSHFWV